MEKSRVYMKISNTSNKRHSSLRARIMSRFSAMEGKWMHLKSALLAKESPNCILSLARQAGGGSITTEVQAFILEHCINDTVGKASVRHDIYMRSVLKSIIFAAESSYNDVIEGLYEQFAHYMTLNMEDDLLKENNKIYKHVAFYLSDGHTNICTSSRNLVATLHCSLNMLEGDTGCALWPSSLFLSEFILSHSGIFSNKYCLEVGSGVGLVGISLAYVGATKVILTDGDLSTLANMERNLELNQLITKKKVECRHLLWEAASKRELRSYQADIVLGADVIYDPRYVPHLVRVLSDLLNCSISDPYEEKISKENGAEFHQQKEVRADHISPNELKEAPIAYVATVIRNPETLNYFLKLASEANLSVQDITETNKPLNLLPYMLSYDRASVHLYKLSSIAN